MADDQDDCGKLTHKPRGRYSKYMRHSNLYKFAAARRRKGNLYKSKQSSTGTCNDLNKCDVKDMIPAQAQPLCMHGDDSELFLSETNSMMPGEACSYLEDVDNLTISVEEFKLLDFTDSNTFEKFVKDEDACSVTARTLMKSTRSAFLNSVKQNQKTHFTQELPSQVAQVLCCCYLLCLNTSLHVKHSIICLL